jgi:hypothetical protein
LEVQLVVEPEPAEQTLESVSETIFEAKLVEDAHPIVDLVMISAPVVVSEQIQDSKDDSSVTGHVIENPNIESVDAQVVPETFAISQTATIEASIEEVLEQIEDPATTTLVDSLAESSTIDEPTTSHFSMVDIESEQFVDSAIDESANQPSLLVSEQSTSILSRCDGVEDSAGLSNAATEMEILLEHRRQQELEELRLFELAELEVQERAIPLSEAVQPTKNHGN